MSLHFFIDEHCEYVEVAPGLFVVYYLTMDESAYHLIVVTNEIAEALAGTGSVRYLPDGTPAVLIATQ